MQAKNIVLMHISLEVKFIVMKKLLFYMFEVWLKVEKVH